MTLLLYFALSGAFFLLPFDLVQILAAMPFESQATEAGRGGARQQDRSHRLAVNDRRAKLRRGACRAYQPQS
jgi:hypothetical protein